jgi:hypothetical protein
MLKVKASHNGQVEIPDKIMDAYIMQKLGWTYQELQQTPAYIIEQIILIWQLQNIADDSNSRKSS